MLNLKYSSLFSGVVILAGGLLLTACATNSNPKTPKAGRKSSVPASACIGNAYLQKYGCSTRRITQAAKSGDPDAQYALGYMYYYGIGTVRDKQTAKLWIDRAADQGQPLAKKAETLIENGRHFDHLHRQHSPRGSAYSGSGRSGGSAHSRGRSANAMRHAPTPSVDAMNSAAPEKSLKDVLPNYKGNTASEPKSTEVIKSLQKKEKAPTADDVNPGKVEPITQRDPRSAPNASSITASSHARSAMTAVEARMMEVPKNHFTLQLMGGRNPAAMREFIKEHNLEGKAHFYSATLNHEKWYMLVYGNYPNLMRARIAMNNLPASLRKLHPWAKSYRIVQDEIRFRRIVT